MKVFVALAALLVAASAEPEPHYYGHYLGHHYGHHQLQWPSAAGPGFSSTCFGCRGKRSAEAEADPALAAHPGHATSYVSRSPQGASALAYHHGYHGYHGPHGLYHLGYLHHHGKREAQAEAEADPALAAHPGHATSYVSRSPQGAGALAYPHGYHGYHGPHGLYHLGYLHHHGKREAEAEAEADPALAAHPGHATSYVSRSPQGAGALAYPHGYYGYHGHRGLYHLGYLHHHGKRSADAEAGVAYHPLAYHHGYPYGYHGYHGHHHGHATSYVGRTVFGYPAAAPAEEAA